MPNMQWAVKNIMTRQSTYHKLVMNVQVMCNLDEYVRPRRSRYDDSSTIAMDTFVNSVDFQEAINDEEPDDSGVGAHRNRSFRWALTSYTPCSRTCGEGDFQPNVRGVESGCVIHLMKVTRLRRRVQLRKNLLANFSSITQVRKSVFILA